MSSIELSKVLVTGASGFVGGHCALGLAELGFEVIAVGGSSAPCPAVSSRVLELAQCDLTNGEAITELLNHHQPDVIIHAAACANSALCEADPGLAERCNVGATALLLESISECLSQKIWLLQISTDLVFDGASAPVGGYSERESTCPCSVYGKTKAQAEALVSASAVCSTILRTSLVYGLALGQRTGFLGWLEGSLAAAKPVELFVDEWRTPVFSGDIVRVISLLLKSGKCQNELLHVAGRERISRYDFGVIFADTFGYDSRLVRSVFQADFDTRGKLSAAPRPKDASLAVEKLRNVLGIETFAVREGIQALLAERA